MESGFVSHLGSALRTSRTKIVRGVRGVNAQNVHSVADRDGPASPDWD